jgi:uncharacterized protein (UPF0335 family)
VEKHEGVVVKDHLKAFWAELARLEKRWKEVDGRMRDVYGMFG